MKKALIIGATSGIGRELAKIYATNGYEVGIAGRRTELLNSLAAELPVKTYPLTVDICKPDEAIKAVEDLLAEMQDVEIIVISSGTGHLNKALDWKPEEETVMTNVLGFAAMANVAMNYFIKKGSGKLAGISSIAGIRGAGLAPAYNASKAFVSNYLEGLRNKAAKSGLPISVTDICPGFVDTEMAKGDGIFWMASPQKAAKQIYHAIRRKKKTAYITKRWRLIAWLLKILPSWIYNKL